MKKMFTKYYWKKTSHGKKCHPWEKGNIIQRGSDKFRVITNGYYLVSPGRGLWYYKLRNIETGKILKDIYPCVGDIIIT